MLTMERAPEATMVTGANHPLDVLVHIAAALRNGAVVEIGSIDAPADYLARGIVRLAIMDHPICGFGTFIQSLARYRDCTATSLWMRLEWTLDDLYQEAKDLTLEDLARLPPIEGGIYEDRFLKDLAALKAGEPVTFENGIRLILKAGHIMRFTDDCAVALDYTDDSARLIAQGCVAGAARRGVSDAWSDGDDFAGSALN